MQRNPATAITLLIAVASFLLHAYGEPVDELIWRSGMGAAAPWRWISAHVAHLSATHFAANAAAALVLAFAADRLAISRGLPGAWVMSLIAVDLGLLVGPWQIAWYAGASGTLYGVAGWVCLRLALDPMRLPAPGAQRTAAALYALLVVRVLWSLATPVGETGWLGVATATPAHLYGLVGGSIWALLRRAR